jgi:hypothetical protein
VADLEDLPRESPDGDLMSGRAARAAAESTPIGAGIPGRAVLLAFATFAFISATNILTPLLPAVRDDFGVSIATAA